MTNTDYPLYCVYCGHIAQFVYKGNSMCQTHLNEHKEKFARAPDKEDPEGLSSLFD